MLFQVRTIDNKTLLSIAGVAIHNEGPAGTFDVTTNSCGEYSLVLGVPNVYNVSFSKPGFKTATRDWHLGNPSPDVILVGLDANAAVWPAVTPWRGAFCIPNALPGQPGNRIWTPAYGTFDDATRAEIRRQYKQRQYTHFPYNIASPDGVYHDVYPALDDDPVRARRDLTELLNDGLTPVVACCNDANGGTVLPYNAVHACADLIPIAFPMWEMNGPLGVDTMVNGEGRGRVSDCVRNTRAALLPQTRLYIHFTAGHGSGAEPEADWWQWAAREMDVKGLMSQDDHWDDPVGTAAGLADTARHLHGHVAGWQGLTLDNVAFELQTTALFHQGRTEAEGLAFMRQVLPNAGEIAGFCDSGN